MKLKAKKLMLNRPKRNFLFLSIFDKNELSWNVDERFGNDDWCGVAHFSKGFGLSQ